MTLTNEQWWWNGNDIYNNIMMVFTMRYLCTMRVGWYLQWGTKTIYRWNEKKMMITYTLGKLWTFAPINPASHKKKIFNNEFFCDAWRHLGWRQFCCRVGTPTPLLGALSWYGHKQLPVRLMGPPCSLQPGIDKPAWHPQLNSERLHVHWYVTLRSWSGSWRNRHSGLACRTWDFRPCGFLRGLLGNGGTGA